MKAVFIGGSLVTRVCDIVICFSWRAT